MNKQSEISGHLIQKNGRVIIFEEERARLKGYLVLEMLGEGEKKCLKLSTMSHNETISMWKLGEYIHQSLFNYL
ncbi:hypothetical protein JFL43_20895 [Viridibacillus sp. YIM B01967]|uniref:Uncharacterized protein n=1 Tax=Viridibacillus soli TaxID=2798301 RepID=A0ABS1HE21_9BACL|nr:hypothetical protein [Viridibacillus soli]MBK3497238.1 hypothetical protein [Viridibacillus soli]